ncbi:RICIN domain-containing protein [Streptomyces sp. NBC_00029]|uniref:RICIN domain-containing protein n=1 Tax=Streptomyces sp. NBC_00029 TaxID=2903613 RepID=UPI00324BB269
MTSGHEAFRRHQARVTGQSAAGGIPATALTVQDLQHRPHRAASGDDPYTAALHNQISGKFLEIADRSTANGAPARQWTCTGGANRSWFSPADC